MLRITSGLILLIAGVIWVLQGFDVAFAPESFMTGDRLWSGAGVVAVVGGSGLIWWGIRAGRHDE